MVETPDLSPTRLRNKRSGALRARYDLCLRMHVLRVAVGFYSVLLVLCARAVFARDVLRSDGLYSAVFYVVDVQ